jgi:hypothetical protein
MDKTPTNSHVATIARRGLLAAAVMSVLAAALPAHAVQVSVAVGGLPPGLSPSVVVMRTTCRNVTGFTSNPEQALTETSNTVFESVILPSGQATIRSKVVTRYVASFDTPVTPSGFTGPLEHNCSLSGSLVDTFNFKIKVPGVTSTGQPTSVSGFIPGYFPQGPVTASGTMIAQTTFLTAPPFGTLSRGMRHSIYATYKTTMGVVQAQRLDFQRPSNVPGVFTTVATLFVGADGSACVKAGSTTRCLNDGASPEAGGVLLRDIKRSMYGMPDQVSFEFELTQSFAPGTVRVRASADAADLPAYIVDGAPQVLNLLPWQAKSETFTVQ